MELGRLQLPIAGTYSGDSDASHAAAHNAFYLLQRELSRSPGEASFVASAAITKGQAVNLDSGLLRLADASLSRPAIGIALSGGIAGDKIRIMLVGGYVQGLTGLTANSLVYLGNAGALLFVRPVSGLVQSLGFALSTTEMFVLVSSDLATIGGGGGGSTLAATVTVTAPATTTLEHVEQVAFVGCTPAKKILVSLAPALSSDENEPVDLRILSLSAVAGTDVATISLIFDEQTSGPIQLHLLAV